MSYLEGNTDLNYIIILVVAAVILLALQLYLGRKGKQALSLRLIAVPLIASVIAAVYIFFFADLPEGGRFFPAVINFVRINIITVMMAAVYTQYFGKRR